MKIRQPIATKFILVALTLVLLPVSSQAETLQGEFDWSGATTFLSLGPGPSPSISGTAYFVYDTTTNEGSISGLPNGFGDEEDGTYDFSAYYNISGNYEAFPVTSFSALTTNKNFTFNGEPISPTWIISPISSLDGIDLLNSGGYLDGGNLLLKFSGVTDESGFVGEDPQFVGTSNFIQGVPEPGPSALLIMGGAGLLFARHRWEPGQPLKS